MDAIWRQKCLRCIVCHRLNMLFTCWHSNYRLLSWLVGQIACLKRKNLYTCTSTFSAVNKCGPLLFKSFSYVYEVIRTNVFANYWSYQNFDGNFEKIVVKSCNEYENYVVHLKQQWIPKKNRWISDQNRPINRHTILVWTMCHMGRQMKCDIQPVRVVRSPQSFICW